MAGTQQYRPISNLETQADNGYNVRAVLDQAENLDNAVAYCFNSPILSIPCFPYWYSFDNNADENIIYMSPPIVVPECYTKLAFAIGDKVTAASGGSTVSWKIYAHEWRYWGGNPIDTTRLSSGYTDATIDSADTSHEVLTPALTGTLPREQGNEIYLVLTAQNETVTERGYIDALVVWPVVT